MCVCACGHACVCVRVCVELEPWWHICCIPSNLLTRLAGLWRPLSIVLFEVWVETWRLAYCPVSFSVLEVDKHDVSVKLWSYRLLCWLYINCWKTSQHCPTSQPLDFCMVQDIPILSMNFWQKRLKLMVSPWTQMKFTADITTFITSSYLKIFQEMSVGGWCSEVLCKFGILL